MRKIILILFVLISFVSMAQQKGTDHFTIQIREEPGDLNQDGLSDKTVISMDTVNANQPLKLEIYFQQADGKFKLFFSSTNIFNPQYPKGKYGGDQILYAFIEDGYLVIYSEIKDFHYQDKFKFNKGNFELVNFSSVIWGGKDYTTEAEFDLLKGIKTEITQALSSGDILKKEEKKLLIKPLPTIQNFRTLEKQWK
jgi:hypothetical protein